MSKLFDFLHPIADKEEKEVIISKRFVKRDNDGNVILDEDGKAVLKPFRIRAVSQEENEAIAKSATRTHKDRSGQTVRDFDKVRYSRSLVVAATVEPDFRSSEMCQAFGTMDPMEVPGKMLYSGEYQKLADSIAELSGIGEDLEEAAKK